MVQSLTHARGKPGLLHFRHSHRQVEAPSGEWVRQRTHHQKFGTGPFQAPFPELPSRPVSDGLVADRASRWS